MHEKKSQFIHLKIPPHLVGLLGKIHALSIEVPGISCQNLRLAVTQYQNNSLKIKLRNILLSSETSIHKKDKRIKHLMRKEYDL